MSNYRLGFDIGGTFTDFVLMNEVSGELTLHKCLTTPSDPAKGVMDGLEELLAKANCDGENINIAIHATTLITNALIEKKGAKTALVTTKGFRDVLEMGTEVRYDIYDLFLDKPEPLVPRKLRFEVNERLDKDGQVLVPLNGDEVASLGLNKADVESVAVTLLHSFLNDEHEQAIRQKIKEILPGATVSISSEVAPEIREFERMSTTVANAYVQPITNRYVDRLQQGLADRGYKREMFMMLSSGGIATTETAKEFPIRLVESGPAAGVLAASFFGKLGGLDSIISFDMGGTTAKIGVVNEGRPSMSNVMEIARTKRFKKGSGIPVKIPVIELIEIGAGGGSIARIDDLGLLKVGPQSAGADPGPACYGFGGKKPTVTDANLVLGYLNPDYFLGGEMELNVGRAKEAIKKEIAVPLGLSESDAARGIYEVVNESMASAMKVHIAERGEDPRKFFLVSFGGAGPVHAYELARKLNMRGIIVPSGAGAASAQGLLTTPVSFEFARSLYTSLDSVGKDELVAIFAEMEDRGREILGRANITDEADITVKYSMDLRHRGQGRELTIEYPRELIESGDHQKMAQRFYEQYSEKYGHAHEHLPVELITCRLVTTGKTPVINLAVMHGDATDPERALEGTRPVYFVEAGEYLDTPVYNRYQLAPNTSFTGPAIIEERESTTIVGVNSQVTVDKYLNLVVEIKE